MFKDLTGKDIRIFQIECLKDKTWPDKLQNHFDDPVWSFIQNNHRYNSLLWGEEDLARRRNVSDTEIASNKRNIDNYNQKRNDHIEKIDEAIINRITTTHEFKEGTWMNSETAGSIIDRLSINALRGFNMEKQMEQENSCTTLGEKLKIVEHQGHHLLSCLNVLLKSIQEGKAIFRTYKQLKMYNDLKLNPYLKNV